MRFYLYSYAIEFHKSQTRTGLLYTSQDLYAGMTRENIKNAISVVLEARGLDADDIKRTIVQMVSPDNIQQLVEAYADARRDAGLGNEWLEPYVEPNS